MDLALGQTVVWDAVAGADDYQVLLTELGGTIVTQLDGVVGTSVTAEALFLDANGDSKVTTGQSYLCKVRARNALGYGPFSQITVKPASPAAPTNVGVN